MTHLTRKQSTEPLSAFRREFDELFNRFWGGWPGFGEHGALGTAFTPPLEVYVDQAGKKFCVRVSLPGVEPNDVQIHAEGNTLTITGERKFTRESKDVEYLHREFGYGTFQRTLTLPESVEVDKISAEFNNGLLEISAPLAEAALPRRIEIKSRPQAKGVSA